MILIILDTIKNHLRVMETIRGINHEILRDGIAPLALKSSHKDHTWIVENNF